MKQQRLTYLTLAAFAMSVLVLACSSGAAPPPGGVPVAAPVNQKPDDGGGRTSDETSDGSEAAPGASLAPGQQPVVYTGSLELQVDDLRASVDQAGQLVVGLGGHVASSETANKGDAEFATATYRIPAENWDEALTGLRALGVKILDETTKSEDVTGQVVDLDARIANAQASEAALQAIMTKAVTIDEVLSVQRELTDVRGDIESMTAQRDLLANRAALATLAVTFETVVAEAQVAAGGWDLAQVIDDALAALVRVGQAGLTLAVWLLIVVVPIVVPLLLVVGLIVWFRRRRKAAPGPEAPSV